MQHDNKISFRNVTKKFGTLVANDSINFDVKDNEIHALLGENGAGKSTLMSILFGLYKPTSGQILINNEEVRIKDPKHANKLKIAMLPQHFKLVENMSVLENIMLGYEDLPRQMVQAEIDELKPSLDEAKNMVKSSEGDVKTHSEWVAKYNELMDQKRALKKKLTSKYILNKKIVVERVEKTKAKYEIEVDLNANVGNLSISDKQKVELLKILWGDANILIFDEPTSILTPAEIERFLDLVRELKKTGKTILIITHKLSEIKAIADRVTIIRKGKYIDTVAGSTPSKKLASLMVGEEIDLNLSTIKKTKFEHNNDSVLSVLHLSYTGKGYEKSLKDITFDIYPGEILGIAAIDGNGQSELMKIIAGELKANDGIVNITGHDVTSTKVKHRYYTKEEPTAFDKALKEMKPADERKSKEWDQTISLLSNIHEDRHSHALLLDESVTENAVLQDLKFFTNKIGVLKKAEMKNRLDYFQEKYDIRGIVEHKTKVRALSGGNQQKLIIAREIERNSNLLLAAHPTRGLDIGAIRNAYQRIIDARNTGAAILLSSGELDEIMQVSDRIIVIYEGKIVSVTEKGKLTKLQLGTLMSTGQLIKGEMPKGSPIEQELIYEVTSLADIAKDVKKFSDKQDHKVQEIKISTKDGSESVVFVNPKYFGTSKKGVIVDNFEQRYYFAKDLFKLEKFDIDFADNIPTQEVSVRRIVDEPKEVTVKEQKVELKAPAKKPAAKKAPAKAETPAKKTVAKKAPTKAPAKKAPAKAKATTKAETPAKKTVAKKVPAKAPAKKAPAKAKAETPAKKPATKKPVAKKATTAKKAPAKKEVSKTPKKGGK